MNFDSLLPLIFGFLGSGTFVQIISFFKSSQIEKDVKYLKKAEENRQHNNDLLVRLELIADDDMKMYRSESLRCYVSGATREFILFVKTMIAHQDFKSSCKDLGTERLRGIFRWEKDHLGDVMPTEFVPLLWPRIDQLNKRVLSDFMILIQNPLNGKKERFETFCIGYVQQFNVIVLDIYNEFVELDNFRSMVRVFKENENENSISTATPIPNSK